MEQHHEFFVSTVFNRYIANPLAELFGYHAADHDVLPPYLVMILLIALGLVIFALVIRRRLSVHNPGAVQQSLELWLESILALMGDIIGSHAQRFFPVLGALFLYILAGNLIGLIPGFMSPTSNINVTASCAVVVFLYYNYHGIRAHGFWKYMAHFAGPSLVIAPLLFVIEIISHLARPFSLSVRLFGNIYAEELIIGSLNAIFPFLLTLPVMALALFASTVQAFIFIVLSMVYIGGAVEHSHEEHHETAS
ncbi:MAG: F0F1 ATP synthase subunit A [Acidobacteria bacterium]|nr:F0F1 ATP synthase subunit A [Acidobacteriota bacterium]